jgi:hypothetical protein
MEGQAQHNVDLLGQLYCGIMDCVADRLDSVSDAIAQVEADPHHPHAWRHAEFAYLQTRKSVEYVALALLAAHRENGYECEKLENAYKADVIFNDLGKLNAHGFPVAVHIDAGQQADAHVVPHLVLSKRRMKRIYDDCAVHLHSGKLSDIIEQNIPPYDLPRVAGWRAELESLLAQHHVMLPHVGIVMIVWLRSPETGRARVIFGAAEGPFTIEGDPEVFNDGMGAM